MPSVACSGAGTRTEPSACWWFSRIATMTRGTFSELQLQRSSDGRPFRRSAPAAACCHGRSSGPACCSVQRSARTWSWTSAGATGSASCRGRCPPRPARPATTRAPGRRDGVPGRGASPATRPGRPRDCPSPSWCRPSPPGCWRTVPDLRSRGAPPTSTAARGPSTARCLHPGRVDYRAPPRHLVERWRFRNTSDVTDYVHIHAEQWRTPA